MATHAAPVLHMSEQEYLDTLADSHRWEFCNGVVTAKREEFMTRRDHVTIAEEFSAALRAYRIAHGGFSGQTPTTNLSAGPDRVYRLPDLGYWSPERVVGDEIFLPPTLAIELVSKDQSVPELRKKCRAYLEHGVDECWLVDPQRRTVEVFDAERDGVHVPADGALESPRLPGFRMLLAGLFGTLG